MPKIVTANMLATGTVVFLGAGDTWVEAIDRARLFADSTAAEAGLAVGTRDAAAAIVVDPFVTEIGEPDGAGPGERRMSLRDAIRARGPTIDFRPAAARG